MTSQDEMQDQPSPVPVGAEDRVMRVQGAMVEGTRERSPMEVEEGGMEQNMNIKQANGLSEAALAMLAAIGRLAEADRAAVLRAHGLALGPRLWRVQDGNSLPTLTRLLPDRDREAIYASDAWAAAHRPVETLIAYVLQAPGLAELSALLGGVPLAKLGTAAKVAVVRRIADLGAAEYGAWSRGPQRYSRMNGFDRFTPAPRLQIASQHPLSPVRLGLHGIEVDLLCNLSRNRFEAEFNARVLPLRLQTVAGDDVGRELCRRTGVDPQILRRHYKIGTGYRAATEVTLFRAQADSNALAKLAADIVIDHVLGLLPRRSGR
ncbi:hypothetical protein D3273_14205 [Lichenibacterium minor]|uniref:Uncharacterized protein n=1 Tax=Lichenibacterium minor TaxID=2316528 RepID=A0A4Q2U885_9HYPH|nr:hypothetical protein [Lichenibacterium minor]RYC31267.1 hypothetical protein D3273_14205 [Lichenibacterium minor]